MREFKQIEEKTTHSFRVGRVDREHGGGQEAGSGAEHQPGDGRVVVLQLLLDHHLPHRDGGGRQDPHPLLLRLDLAAALTLGGLLLPHELLLLGSDHLDLFFDRDKLNSLD